MIIIAHYIKIPKDLSLIKQKFMFGLTKRQVVCFGIGLAMGLPAFYIFNKIAGIEAGCLALGILAAPAVLCGLYNKNGMHFEQIAKLMFQFLKKPKKRTYQSENAFAMIARQLEYNKLKKLLNTSETKKNR